MFGEMGRHRTWALALAVANVKSVVCGLAETYTMFDVYDWQRASEMELSISAPGTDTAPVIFTIFPLTTNLGLNASQASRGKIRIGGLVSATNENNYDSVNGSFAIPYICCDRLDNSFIQPDMILNDLINHWPQPAAIILYSLQGMCCGFAGHGLTYNAFVTMADEVDASQLLTIANALNGTADARISGNFTQRAQVSDDGQSGGNNSSIAMSILYGITGLISILFVLIIATGAIRARRYPERYGPRNGSGGAPRQSRARGLARAVLETIPIVKFGDSTPPKQDPTIELENAQRAGMGDVDGEVPNNGSSRHLSTISESNPGLLTQPAVAGAVGAVPDSEGNVKEASSSASAGASNAYAGALSEEGLGCSICTDDFTVGEDVRVLPCDHKFHPQCIDPWLVNVSGTCPLCRLDLRPNQDEGEGSFTEAGEAPPLGGDHEGGDPSHASHRRSRLFELHGVRHATVEERIEALRRYRAEQRQGSSGNHLDETHTRARLTDRLRERFHIRTRAAQRSSTGQDAETSAEPTPNASQV